MGSAAFVCPKIPLPMNLLLYDDFTFPLKIKEALVSLFSKSSYGICSLLLLFPLKFILPFMSTDCLKSGFASLAACAENTLRIVRPYRLELRASGNRDDYF